MARPNSYNKRDQEKKKQEKRVEKQKKKDERKLSGKANSFDDMIAYVDENGIISSTPPEPTIEKKTGHELITTSSVMDESRNSQGTDIKGTVEHINSEKGYGFIKETKTINKYFFHISGLVDAVQIGDHVLFDIERGKKGYNAVNIKKIS